MKGRRWGVARQRVRSMPLTEAISHAEQDQRVTDLQATIGETVGSLALERAIVGSKLHIGLAQLAGARVVFHDADARKNPAGLPDVLMIVGDTFYLIECKGKYPITLPEEQEAWQQALAGVKRIVYGVVRPANYEDFAKEVMAQSLLDQEPQDTTTPQE